MTGGGRAAASCRGFGPASGALLDRPGQAQSISANRPCGSRGNSPPGAVGYEVELLQHDYPDQGIGESRFDDCVEDAGAALNLQLDITDNRLGLPAIVGKPNRDLAGFGQTQRGHHRRRNVNRASRWAHKLLGQAFVGRVRLEREDQGRQVGSPGGRGPRPSRAG